MLPPVLPRTWALLVPLLLAGWAGPAGAASPAGARSRTFEFTYAATVTGLEPGQSARIWLPVAPSNDDQDAKVVRKELPAQGRLTREPEYGNRILYLEAKADVHGKVPLKVVYRVTRREVKGERS